MDFHAWTPGFQGLIWCNICGVYFFTLQTDRTYGNKINLHEPELALLLNRAPAQIE